MTTTIIHIDLDAVDERLHRGELWAKGWNDWASPESATCLHGAIRYCQPVKGDAYLIEQVGAKYGFGTRDNDTADGWEQIKAKVIPDITDDMLADTFGPNWGPIVAFVRRAATLTQDEVVRLGAAWDAAGGAARDAAGGAAWGVSPCLRPFLSFTCFFNTQTAFVLKILFFSLYYLIVRSCIYFSSRFFFLFCWLFYYLTLFERSPSFSHCFPHRSITFSISFFILFFSTGDLD